MKHPIVALALAAALVAPLFGDVVHLKHGGTIEGQVVQTDDAVIVKVPEGEVRLPKSVVVRIEKKPTRLDEYQKRAAAIKEGDAAAHYKLGLWAGIVGLKTQAKEQFGKAIAIEPDHAQARHALGYRMHGGRWVTRDEEMKARGLLKHEGAWMSPEAAAKLRALEAELEVAREKRRTAEAELERERKAPKAPALPPGYSPTDRYYSTRGLDARSRVYYRGGPYGAYSGTRYYYYGYGGYPLHYYSSPYGLWHLYPGGRRHVSPSRRRHPGRPPRH